MKTAILIPARYASSRFPGKSVQFIGDHTVIQHVWMRANEVRNVEYVAVVTDDERIAESVHKIGGVAIMSASNHENGTSRIAEAAVDLKDYKYIINLQGDEPLINPSSIESFVDFLKEGNADIATLKTRNYSDHMEDGNVVKVVTDINDNALYFSRSPIPYDSCQPFFHQHIGIYGFKNSVLAELVDLPESLLEQSERLEQLRWLEHGYKISVLETAKATIGIDVPADLNRVRKIIEND